MQNQPNHTPDFQMNHSDLPDQPQISPESEAGQQGLTCENVLSTSLTSAQPVSLRLDKETEENTIEQLTWMMDDK